MYAEIGIAASWSPVNEQFHVCHLDV